MPPLLFDTVVVDVVSTCIDVVSTWTMDVVEVVVVADKNPDVVDVGAGLAHADVQVESELQYAEEEPHHPHFDRQWLLDNGHGAPVHAPLATALSKSTAEATRYNALNDIGNTRPEADTQRDLMSGA